jgi:hypothetical protein
VLVDHRDDLDGVTVDGGWHCFSPASRKSAPEPPRYLDFAPGNDAAAD